MLHIMLMILKIIGIILLSILGLIILLLLCILFVPVRYRSDVIYKDRLNVRVKFTYLLHLITITYNRDKESDTQIRILGIRTRFFSKDEKKKQHDYDKETEMFERMSEEIKESQDEVNPELEKFKKIDEARDEQVEETVSEYNELQVTNQCSVTDTFQETDVEKTKIDDESHELDTKKESENNSESDENTQEEQSFISKKINKIKNAIKNFIDKLKKIKFRFYGICGTIRKAYHKVGDFKAFLSDDKTKEAFSLVKNEAFGLLKHVRPRKIKGYLHFGFDDPAYTGQVLGIIYMITRGVNKNVQINPDFENKALEGELHIKGRVQGYVLLIIALKLYRNENLKAVLERRRTYGRE